MFGFAAVDDRCGRFGTLAQVGDLLGNDQCCGRIQQDDIAISARSAIEERMDSSGIIGRVGAEQVFRIMAFQTRLLGAVIIGADATALRW